MFIFLSKFLPLLVYPIGLVTILLAAALIFGRKKRLRTWLIIAVILILFLGGNRWVAHSLVRSLEWRYFPPEDLPTAEVIVVLGGGTDPADYPRSGVEVNGAGDRVLEAARLYKAGKAPHLLLSGGQITWLNNRSSTPAEEMAELLVLMGVPEEAFWLQPKSQNTYEDALYSAQILRDKGIQRVILVTSATHMPRSVACFEKQGIEVIPVPADYTVTQSSWYNLQHGGILSQIIALVPTSGNLGMTTNAMREYIGMWTYRLKGWN